MLYFINTRLNKVYFVATRQKITFKACTKFRSCKPYLIYKFL